MKQKNDPAGTVMFDDGENDPVVWFAPLASVVAVWAMVVGDEHVLEELKATVSAPETLNGEVNMYDHQTLLLSTTEKTKPDSQLIVLLTATLVDPVGIFVHADDELPFAQNGAPPQN